MFFADNEYGLRTYIDDADASQSYFCPVCNAPMLQKRGDIVAHHFAHQSKGICDPWYSGKMSAWHKEMQNLFPRQCQEVIVHSEDGEYHIADVVSKKGSMSYVVEFQHSAISRKEFVAHTDFYMSQGYGMIWVFDFCNVSSPKVLYYTEEKDSDWLHVFWPGKDRSRFFDSIDLGRYGEKLHIYFHVSTGKGHKITIESDYFYDWECWEYINPFQRERLFIKLYLPSLQSLIDFFALPYSEEDFYKKLKDIGKSQK